MTETTNFQEKRIRNRKSYLEERKLEEKIYSKHVRKINERCDNLTTSLNNFLSSGIGALDINEMILNSAKLGSLRAATFDNMEHIVKEEVKELDSAKRKFYEDFGVNVEREYFTWKKKKLKKLYKEKVEKGLKNYRITISHIQDNLETLKNLLRNEKYKTKENNTDELLNIIERLGEIFNIESGAKEVDSRKIEKLEEEFLQKSKDYKNKLILYKPKFEGNIKTVARENIRLLEEELESLEDKKNEYFDSLEGLVLSYSTYGLSRK